MFGIIVRNTGIKPVLVKSVPRIPSQGFRGVMTIFVPSAPFHVVVHNDIHDHFADMLTALYTFASIPTPCFLRQYGRSFFCTLRVIVVFFQLDVQVKKMECFVPVQ
jgi:hypothetical protein